jgi:hypothetical protein
MMNLAASLNVVAITLLGQCNVLFMGTLTILNNYGACSASGIDLQAPAARLNTVESLGIGSTLGRFSSPLLLQLPFAFSSPVQVENAFFIHLVVVRYLKLCLLAPLRSQ